MRDRHAAALVLITLLALLLYVLVDIIAHLLMQGGLSWTLSYLSLSWSLTALLWT